MIFLVGTLVGTSIGTVSAVITVDLNSPADGSTSYIPLVSFNITSVTTVPFLKNISLYTKLNSGSFIFNQTFLRDPFCYQETANAVNVLDGDCGLNYTGTYQLTGPWSTGTNTYDGNWATGGGAISLGEAYLYINYTKPLYAINATWEVKDSGTSANLTIPAICFNAFSDHINLKVTSHTDAGGGFYFVRWSCYNGTDYASLRYVEVQYTVYEESIHWGLGNTSERIFTNNYTSGDTILWNALSCDIDNDCYFAASNYTLYMDATPPTISVTSPQGLGDYGYPGKTLVLNFTATDTNLDSCWYNYNNINTSISCSSGVLNSSNFISTSQKNITVYANDSLGNLNSTYQSWDYKIFKNSQIYETLTYETASETFSINVTANSSLTDVNLIHNSISHDTTLSGGLYNITFDIPNSVGNKTFYWEFIYAGSTINSENNNQTVNNTLLGLCNATLLVPYINFTFVDEETLLNINATIDTSTWTYWLGDGTITKSLLYSNTTPNDNYAFCLSASNDTMYNTRTVQYASPGYPQRKYDSSSDLTNVTTNKTLYLLSSTDGIYTTIQVLDTESNQLLDVEVTAERQFSGTWTVVGEETTDSAGSVTFWVNPDYDHRFTFVKEGCTGTTITIRPTQTQYTQQLSCGVTSDYTSTIEGLKYSRTPVGGIIQPGVYNFTYYLVSSKDNIINASFYIVNASDQTVLNSSVSTCTVSGCLLFFTYNVTAGNDIKGRYYVDVGNGSLLIEGDAWWRCIEISTAGKAGIATFFQDVIYIFQEWGDDTNTADFNRLVVIFFLICISISVLNYNFNMDSINPGMFLSILTFIIVMGSIVGGTNPTATSHGLFYYNNLTTSAFINNYLLAGVCLIITFTSFLNVNRQGQR